MRNIIFCLFTLFFITCKGGSELDRFSYYKPKSLTSINAPVVLLNPIKPQYSLTIKSVKNKISQRNINETASYVSILDMDRNRVFNKIRVDNLYSWSNPRGVYSPFSRAYYFFSNGNAAVFKLNSSVGNVDKFFKIRRGPAVMLSDCTSDGYIIINHSLVEKKGFRLTIFDTKTDSVVKDDLFLKSYNPWVFSVYNKKSNKCFFTSTQLMEDGQSLDVLFSLDLTTFEIKRGYSTKKDFHFSNIRLDNDKILLAKNRLIPRDPVTDELITDQNDPSFVWVDEKSLKPIEEIKVFDGKTEFKIYNFFIYKNALYSILAKSMIPANKDFGETNILKLDRNNDRFTRLETDCLYNLFWNEFIIRDSKAHFLAYNQSFVHNRIINLETFNIEDDKDLIIY